MPNLGWTVLNQRFIREFVRRDFELPDFDTEKINKYRSYGVLIVRNFAVRGATFYVRITSASDEVRCFVLQSPQQHVHPGPT